MLLGTKIPISPSDKYRYFILQQVTCSISSLCWPPRAIILLTPSHWTMFRDCCVQQFRGHPQTEVCGPISTMCTTTTERNTRSSHEPHNRRLVRVLSTSVPWVSGAVSQFHFFFFHLTCSRWTSSLPSCLWSQRIFPSLPGSRLTIFYRDASSALLQLVNQWLNFTYSRSNAFRYERKNTNPTLVRIELTTSVLADVQLTY